MIIAICMRLIPCTYMYVDACFVQPSGCTLSFEDQQKHMYCPLPLRKEILSSLKDEELDILVIGGGATGTGVALDAVTRGNEHCVFHL